MLKAISAASLLMLACQLSYADQDQSKEWVSLSKEHVFAAEILTREPGLSYWAMPLEQDKDGYKSAMDMIAELNSVAFKQNPLAINFILAGVRLDNVKGVDLIEDDFNDKVEAALDTIGKGAYGYIHCTGRYMDKNIPLCYVDFENGKSLERTLIEKGYVTISDNKSEVPNGTYPLLMKAQERAMAAEVGIWKPFHFMMRGVR